MTAFHPFETAENALENINAITEHEMTDDLRTFLEANLVKGKKASKFPLGVVRHFIAKYQYFYYHLYYHHYYYNYHHYCHHFDNYFDKH
jgi:F420-0:gamma-glutamyl ligase